MTDNEVDENGSTDSETITIIGKEDDSVRGGLIKLSDYLYDKQEVPVSRVEEQFQTFLQKMRKVIQNAPTDFGEFRLDSLTISAEVSAKGSISLIGGAELGGKGGITITLKKPSSK